MINIPVRPATCACLAVLGWMGAILGDGSDQWLLMICIMWIAAAGVILYPVMRRIKLPGRRRYNITTQEVRQDYFTTFWLWVELHIPYIRHIRVRYAAKLRHMGASITYDYDLHARRAIHIALSVIPLAFIPIITGEIMLSPIAAAPAILVYPMVHIQNLVGQHKVQVTEEMSFFLCYLSTMQGAGYTLYTALERMRDAPDVFHAMKYDASKLIRKVALGTPHMVAIREYAASHPVQEFKDFLHGYISKHETVGPVPSYTESKAEQFFESYKQTWQNYKQTAIMMATMAVMVSVMIPIMMVMMIFISTQDTVNMILTMGPMMGPILAVLLLFMVSTAQPSTGVKMKPWLPCIGVGISVGILVHMSWMTLIPGGDIWDTEPGFTISISFVAAGLSNYIMRRKQLGGAENVDRGLPEFLQDVTEQTMSGSSISRILRQQARGGVYSGLFGGIMRGIVSRLESGAPLEEACREARRHSKYLAFTLFIIIRLQEIGATSPVVLKQMTLFMAGIVTTKMDVIKSLRMGGIMIYIAPILLMGIMNAMFAMFDTDATITTSPLANILPAETFASFAPPDPDSGYQQRLGMLGALLTCPMGLVAAKITRFTTVDTIPLVIVSVVNALAIIIIPILFDAVAMV